ncbi:MAG TPA: ABC transporter ATP-binding protein [Rhodopila sp.]|uniref:ABC transporter ATP-binding protein n=1 Tax=Rhodopila sp. TaxID=2480087 RepID=UPI002B6A5BDA|nr:ABC transporter ATP-binding protein [Rhodopila sp.]HVY16075.1 ABC transporter ATP-binding protein [Rhodopila sp.]
MTQPPLPTGKGALELQDLVKNYGAEPVVNHVSASIRPGEFFSLLGPSGSGKTTTLMMIAGFVSPDSGAIRMDGADLTRVPAERRGLGMVFQNYAIFPHLNVFENVAFPLRARRVAETEIRARVKDALGLVQLDRYATRYARQLSGGQQQRVAIARAIVYHPPVVLMDEPLGALDKNLRYDMQMELKDIQQRLGMTVVYVTHDQEEAMNLSDRIAIMNHGRIEQAGEPGTIYETPANAFVARFLGEANLIPGTIETTQSDEALLVTPAGLRLRAPTGDARPGQPASLFIRPEKLSLTATTGNVLAGTVRRRSFLGNIIRLSVEVAADTNLTVDLANTGVEPPAPGATTTVAWPVGDGVYLTQ